MEKIIFKKIFYQVTDSTSDQLEKMARENASEGTVVIAGQQTSGRGQGKNNWVSEPGGLYFSLLIRPRQNLPLLPLMTGVAVVQTLSSFVEQSFFIKWPNDIICNTEKVCGILVESRYSGNNPAYVIVGCGININQANFNSFSGYRASSLKILSGQEFISENILDLFLENFQKLYFKYRENGPASILAAFKPLLYRQNKIIRVRVPGNQVIEGKLTGISEEGGLMILKSNGICETIFSGKIIEPY